jgi:hypothetical protein
MMRKCFLVLLLILSAIMIVSVSAFAVDEMTVETDLLKDMLANIAAKTSGIEENNTFAYGDCIYSIMDSRGSLHIIYMNTYDEKGCCKTRYGVIDADSEKVLIPFRYDRIEFTSSGNFLVRWGQRPPIPRACYSFSGYYSAVLNKNNEEIPLKALPENAFVRRLYDDGLAILYQLSEEGFAKWGIIDIEADKLLLPAIADMPDALYAEYFDLVDLAEIRTAVSRWSLTQYDPKDSYRYRPDDGKFGVVSRYGQIIIPPAYDQMRFINLHEQPLLEDCELEVQINSETKTICVKDFITPSPWAAAFTKDAASAGIVPANLMRNYTGPVTRMELADMTVNLIEAVSGKRIDDFIADKGVETPADPFARSTENILRCRALGIVIGAGGDSFEPSGFITRAEMAVVIDKIGDVLGVDKSFGGTEYTLPFDDLFTSSMSWCAEFIRWPARAGIIAGIGNRRFDPDSALTAEQAITLLFRTLQALN